MINTLLKTGSYINGAWLTTKKTISVVNPSTNEQIVAVANGGIEHANLAIKAASAALKNWSELTAQTRADYLRCWFELILKHQAELAVLLTQEQGKPIKEAHAEISYGASFIEWFAEEGKRVYGDIIPAPSADKQIMVIKQPVGVVSAITPWNFPNAMITRKAAAALAAGCTFIVKPAMQTPLSALALAELAHQAGIPDGVFNVVLGNEHKEIGKLLTQDSRIAKFTFTGSTKVGKLLLEQCTSTVKKVSMELGGNAPFIVFEDADIDAAIKGVLNAKFRNSGQTCIAANRIFVHEHIKEAFTNKLKKAMQVLIIGDGANDSTDLGPLISNEAVNRISGLVVDSIAQGARLLYKHNYIVGDTSCFYPPVLLTNVTNNMPIAKNEIFGPVVAILSFTDEASVIKQANDTEAGLAAYFYSENIKRIWRVAKALQYGMVGINDGAISTSVAPFGGVKESGSGREGSKYGLDDYLEIKYLSLAGLS